MWYPFMFLLLLRKTMCYILEISEPKLILKVHLGKITTVPCQTIQVIRDSSYTLPMKILPNSAWKTSNVNFSLV